MSTRGNELRNEPMPSCSFHSSLANNLMEAQPHLTQNIGPSPAKKLKDPQAGVKTLTSSDVSEKYNMC